MSSSKISVFIFVMMQDKLVYKVLLCDCLGTFKFKLLYIFSEGNKGSEK